MPLKFLGAFVVVLLLIGLAAWLVRRFGAGRLDAAGRGRQPRLAVVDSASVDGRRKLVIVRRDNVEHLLMIGGPTDVVVETAIVRGAAVASRDAQAARNGGNEAALRAMPLPDPTPWPLQPEPALAASAAPVLRAERGFRGDDTWPESPEPPTPPVTAAPAMQPPMVRPVRPADTLAGLAEELARPERSEAPRPERTEALRPAAAAAPPSDQSLAEMAQRLEAALRRPGAQKFVSEGQRVTTIVEVKAAQPKLGAGTAAAAAPPKPAPPAKPQAQPQQPASQTQPQPPAPQAPQTPPQPTDLEQEMASLLGRTGKT